VSEKRLDKEEERKRGSASETIKARQDRCKTGEMEMPQ
jgi:hypothetical protein